jgi:hypothetical protein
MAAGARGDGRIPDSHVSRPINRCAIGLVSVAVALAVAPGHARASSNARPDGEKPPREWRDPSVRCQAGDPQTPTRAAKLPATHKLDRQDTGNSLSKRYYRSRGGALTILWSIGLKNWPPSRNIVESRRYEDGDTIVIPKPPKASINPPSRPIC